MPHVLAQDLRNAVLQAAFEGKLTAREHTDSNVFELLNSLSINEYDGDIPFDLPDNWAWVRFGDISTYTKTKKKINAQNADPDTWMLDMEDIEKGGRLLVKKKVSERKAIGDKTVFNKGNILYSKLRPYLLKVLIADEDGICTPELVPFDMLGKTSARYTMFYLRSPYVDDVINRVTYGVKMPRVGTDTMRNLYFPLPPVEEQIRIVARIDELMAKIDEYEKIEKELTELQKAFPENMKDAILQAAMQGKLTEQSESDSDVHENILKAIKERDSLITQKKIAKVKDLPDPSDDTIPFEIPEQWSWISSDKVGSIVVGATPSTGNSSFWNEGSIPWLPSGCCQDCLVTEEEPTQKKITIEGYNSCSTKMMPINTVMIALTGATAGKVGLLKFEACGNQSIVGITPFSAVLPEFLYYQLMSRRGEILADCVGSAQPHISKDYVTKMAFVAPPIEEQQRIVDKLNQLLPLCESLEAMI